MPLGVRHGGCATAGYALRSPSLCRPCRCTSHAPRKRRDDRNPRHSRRMSRRCCRSTATRSRRSRSRSASCASPWSPRSCWCARARRLAEPKRRRATRSSPPGPRSTASMRCCAPSRRSWSPGPPGRRARDHRRSGLVTDAETPHRVLAFGTWLEPETAQAMERAVEALRARGTRFAHDADDARRPPVEADGQVVGGRAILRLRGRERRQARARRTRPVASRSSSTTPPPLRTLIEALPSPIWARDEAGKLVLRQRRLCARGRGQGRRGGGASAASSCSTAPRAPSFCARTKRRAPIRAGCRRSSPAAAASSTC